jgi:heme exporter protein A
MIFEATKLSCIRQQRILFSDVSFRLEKGGLLLVQGSNGSGKSSLLRILCGIATPYSGDIHWTPQHMHYIGHTNGIKLGLTVLENMRLFAALIQQPHDETMPVLTQLELHPYQHRLAKHLSAGQKRRLALAKLLLFPKPLWILDEPLTALDAHSQRIFLSALETHLKNGGMAIVSSHHAFTLNDVKIQTLTLGEYSPC